ncbi:MAG: efflux RND transporter periplasmic adaptor subunit [Candidatus Krumholzibacteriia bacterium]
MKSSRRLAVVALVAIVAVAVFGVRFLTMGEEENPASIASVQAREGKPVEVVAAARGSIEVWSNLAGTVEGLVQSPIVSQNSMEVVEVVRREGDRVQAGDVVLRLAREAPTPMYHSYARSLAVLEDAQREYERMQNLFEEGAVSRQALDRAETALAVAREDLRNARRGTELTASHAGVVTAVRVKEGETAQVGRPLAYVARVDTVRVRFEAGSRQALALAEGQLAVWRLPEQDLERAGEIVKLDLAADPQTHLLAGEARFPNPDRRLLPGLLVSFDVRTAERTDVITVPTAALVATDTGAAVYLIREQAGEGGDRATARLQPVEVGLRTTDEVEITGGLAAGDLVVVYGQRQLEDGDLVRVVGRRGQGLEAETPAPETPAPETPADAAPEPPIAAEPAAGASAAAPRSVAAEVSSR